MRLHWKPTPSRLGLPLPHQCRGFESGCWSLLTDPVKEGAGWVFWSGTTVSTAAVLEVRPEDQFADFFSMA
jgi:hypothetical protein